MPSQVCYSPRLQTFAEKNFADRCKTAKCAQVFSLESFQLHNTPYTHTYICTLHTHTTPHTHTYSATRHKAGILVLTHLWSYLLVGTSNHFIKWNICSGIVDESLEKIWLPRWLTTSNHKPPHPIYAFLHFCFLYQEGKTYTHQTFFTSSICECLTSNRELFTISPMKYFINILLAFGHVLAKIDSAHRVLE